VETIGSKRSYALIWCMPNNDDDETAVVLRMLQSRTVTANSQPMSLTDVDGTSVVELDAVECLIGGRAFGCTFGTLRDVLRRSADCCCVDSAPQTVSLHQ